MFRRFLDVTFPYPHDAIAARLHIGILRLVKGSAAGLTIVKRGELSGVAMPVVAIELNNQLSRGHEGINAELITDEVLSFIGNTDAVEDGIGGAFKVVWLHAQLFSVHAAQMHGTFWVFVSALKRTISDVVCLDARWRPIKGLAAYLADVFGFVTALPFVSALHRTKTRILGNPTHWHIENDAAYFASDIFARLTLRSSRVAVALKSAIALVGAHVTSCDFATSLACNCTNGVVIHNHILTQLNLYD